MPRSLFDIRLSQKYFLIGLTIGFGLLWGVIRSWPDGKLHIIFCDVGQGDSILIKTPDRREVLIDGGPNNRVLHCLGRYMSIFDRTLDMVIVTHPDKDHIGGIPEVLKRFQVKHYVTTAIRNSQDEFDQVANETADRDPPVSYMQAGDSIQLGEVQLKFFWPDRSWYLGQTGETIKNKNQDIATLPLVEQTNNFSLVSLLLYNDFEVLLTGDADSVPQRIMMSLGLTSQLPRHIDVLKVPHHGSKTGIDQEFLEWILPDTAIIQVGKNNYGHPHPDLLLQLTEVDKIFRNDLDGDIEIVSDGKGYFVRTGK